MGTSGGNGSRSDPRVGKSSNAPARAERVDQGTTWDRAPTPTAGVCGAQFPEPTWIAQSRPAQGAAKNCAPLAGYLEQLLSSREPGCGARSACRCWIPGSGTTRTHLLRAPALRFWISD